jgi:hypothetical protein
VLWQTGTSTTSNSTKTRNLPKLDIYINQGKEIDKMVAEYAKRGIRIKHEYHNVYTDDGMVDFLVSGLNPSRIPGVVIMNNGIT